ncbi:MAG TPA: hypothetical protein VJZ00_05040 [Thermoanaerobaculia bacterium]|nr:hypothetical protein [Thermoanaerobaculia bacterium]
MTNPKRAAYNRIYHRTTVGCVVFVVLLVLVIAVPVFAQTARITGMYHEANCPTVDPQRMTRMKRGAAEAIGLIPAPDCQPGARFRYLGTSSGGYSPYTAAAANSTDSPTAVHVRAHMRDGSYVHEYDRSRPQRD